MLNPRDAGQLLTTLNLILGLFDIVGLDFRTAQPLLNDKLKKYSQKSDKFVEFPIFEGKIDYYLAGRH